MHQFQAVSLLFPISESLENSSGKVLFSRVLMDTRTHSRDTERVNFMWQRRKRSPWGKLTQKRHLHGQQCMPGLLDGPKRNKTKPISIFSFQRAVQLNVHIIRAIKQP